MVEMRKPEGKMDLMDRVEQPSSFYVRVTNMNEGEMSDRCDGVQYIFEPGKPINIPAAAAALIFGWDAQSNCASWEHMSRRWGWNTKAMLAVTDKFPLGEGRAKFDNLIVEGVNVAVVEMPPNMSVEQVQEAVRLASHLPPEVPQA